MREILFKAKRVDNGEWVEGFYTSWSHMNGVGYEMVHAIQNENPPVLVSKETVCQYTGLIDKNGDRIFEGDLLRYNGSARGVKWSIENATSSDSAVVEFSYEYAGGWVLSAGGHSMNIGTRADKLEITGNIHEGANNE